MARPQTGAVLGILLLVSVSASAQETPKPRTPFQWSILLEPIRLLNPIVAVDVERRLPHQLTVVAFAGAGKTKVEMVEGRVLAWEVGAQLGWYALGDFERGMMVAIELVYVSLDTETSLEPDGVGVGPLLGYKVALALGFTFLAQAGVSYFSGDGDLHNSLGLGPFSDRLVANLNLGLGWSF